MLRKNKLSLIHVAKSRLCLDDETYRDILDQVAGVTSARDLDATGFKLVMDRFAALGFKSDFATRNLGRRKGMATPGQISMIRKLWETVSQGGTETHLNRWLENKFGLSALRFLDQPSANKVIHGLKSWQKRNAIHTAA